MTRILAIEDDETTAHEIVSELTRHGFDVEWVADGREGLVRAVSDRFDAVTLDRMLPNVDGLTIVSVMRSSGIDIPVLMISALTEVDERVRGLRAGGDDYMTKPFASEEMAARLEVLLRRQNAGPRQSILRAQDLELDLITREARRGGRQVGLLPTEFKLLEFIDAQRRPGADADHDLRGDLGLPLRPRHQPDRRSHRPPAPQGRHHGLHADDQDHPGLWICSQCDALSSGAPPPSA